MKIYFAGSIRSGREDVKIYGEIIKLLNQYGSVSTEHLSDKNLTSLGENLDSDIIYKRDVSWLDEADIVVAEVTTPSLGVGYEIARAETQNKKILCLYRPSRRKKLSAMIDGNRNLTVKRYHNINDVKIILKNFFK